jgi:hypothetical protein
MRLRVAEVPSISTGFVKAARASVQVDRLVRSPDIANRLSMCIDSTRHDSFVTPLVEVEIGGCAHATDSRAPIENMSASIDRICASIAHLKRRSARMTRTIVSSHRPIACLNTAIASLCTAIAHTVHSIAGEMSSIAEFDRRSPWRDALCGFRNPPRAQL